MDLSQKKQDIFQNHEQSKLNPRLYSIFRLDGHSFSKFVKKIKMDLPFDKNFTCSMKNTAQKCIQYFGFCLGFVGSDQITYVLKPLTEQQIENKGVLPFNGRVQKMVSLLAGRISTTFFIQLTKCLGFQITQQFDPHFDCRVFQVKTFEQVLQNISDRVIFTLKNSRMMLAQTYYNQKQLNKIPSKQAVAKLFQQKGIQYEQLVSSDNRVGNILKYKKVTEKRMIKLKGQQEKEIEYERKKVILMNMGPKQVKQIKQNELV